MKNIRLLTVTALAVTTLFLISVSGTRENSQISNQLEKKPQKRVAQLKSEKLIQTASLARAFVKRKDYNETICLFIDMSLSSGQNRFFIYNLKKDSIQSTGLVAHGNCFEYWLEGRRYSNVVGSGCTSLGKYRVGNSYTGKFGYSYKLHGLDSSNNNAFKRTVVLHSHSCIPDTEVPDEICQSNGCPTVSPKMLLQLKSIINKSKTPVLLWIYQ